MFELITVASIAVGGGLGYIIALIKDKYTEKQALINVSRKNLADAEEKIYELRREISELKELRRNEQKNNTIILEKNTELSNLINEIADRVIQCPLDSEKIVIQKIIDLTRTYQTPIDKQS